MNDAKRKKWKTKRWRKKNVTALDNVRKTVRFDKYGTILSESDLMISDKYAPFFGGFKQRFTEHGCLAPVGFIKPTR